jgi:hypothetical protein
VIRSTVVTTGHRKWVESGHIFLWRSTGGRSLIAVAIVVSHRSLARVVRGLNREGGTVRIAVRGILKAVCRVQGLVCGLGGIPWSFLGSCIRFSSVVVPLFAGILIVWRVRIFFRMSNRQTVSQTSSATRHRPEVTGLSPVGLFMVYPSASDSSLCPNRRDGAQAGESDSCTCWRHRANWADFCSRTWSPATDTGTLARTEKEAKEELTAQAVKVV